jgi:hypothetical protein
LIFIQQNLAHALLFQGNYNDALAIYRQYWDKPINGKTFGEATLEDSAAFDKAGLTHPDLSRMKQALGDLRGRKYSLSISHAGSPGHHESGPQIVNVIVLDNSQSFLTHVFL